MQKRHDNFEPESAASCNETHKQSSQLGRAICGLMLAVVGASFLTPYAVRGSVSKRILGEKDFALSFHDGKFLSLHSEHTATYLARSSNAFQWIKKIGTEIRLETKVNRILKQEKLAYRTLWNATTLGQKFSDFFFASMAVTGLGMTFKSFPPGREPGNEESAVDDTLISLGFDSPGNKISNITATSLVNLNARSL